MRWLMLFSIGFAAACAIGAYLLGNLWLLPAAAINGILAVVLAFIKCKKRVLKVFAVIFLGCAVGMLWYYLYDMFYLSSARAYDGKTVAATVEISDYSYATDYGVSVEGRIDLEGKNYKIRLYLPQNRPLEPGDTVSGEIRLRFTSVGGTQEPTGHQGEGIFFLGYCADNCSISRLPKTPLLYYPAVLRYRITQLLRQSFPEDTLGFARALLLGDCSDLGYETDTALKISGIRHVVAVSGLHVSIMFSLVYKMVGKRRGLTALIAFPVLLLFAALAGFSPSVTRAVVMQCLMILALLINQEYDPPTALGFAVLLMLIINPFVITSVSLQLSAGCMVGIILFSDRISRYLLDEKRLGSAKGRSVKAYAVRWLVGNVSVSASAMVITAPLSAYYFGTISIIGVLTNILTLWVISFIFYGIMLTCTLTAIIPFVGKVVAWVVSWPIRYVLLAAKLLSRFPLAAVYTCSVYVLLWLLFAYVLLGLFIILKKKHPLVFAFCLMATLLASVAISWVEARLENLRVTALDVGQGQCILLQTQDVAYLVDCGGDIGARAADLAAQTLLSQGIAHLDGLILTHYDKDHAGGVSAFLTRISVETLYLPDVDPDNSIRQTLTLSHGKEILWVDKTEVLINGDTRVSLFPGEYSEDDNESGLSVLFQAENCDILITGDRSAKGEEALLKDYEIPDLELLVVGHHGSNNSTSFDFLSAAMPDYAVISVGSGNPYGHPHDDVLNRLYLHGCATYRTDLDGTIIFRR